MWLLKRNFNLNNNIMFGVIAMGIAFLITKKLDDMGDYKPPKGKNKNRYK